MRKIKKTAVIFGLLISLFCTALPCIAASSSSACKKYIQEDMIPSLGKVSIGTKTEKGDFAWCNNRGVLGAYTSDFNGDGKTETVVLYLKKEGEVSSSSGSVSGTAAHLAVLSVKNGKVTKTQDITVENMNGLGVDFRVYVKSYSGKKYIVIQSAGAVDNSKYDIFVLSVDKNGKFSGTGFCGETFEGGYWVQLSNVGVSRFVSSLASFDYNSGTSLLDTEGDLTNARYGQILKSGLVKYGLSFGLSKVSYGTKMWNLKKNSGMTLIGSVQTLSCDYKYGQYVHTTKYQGKMKYQEGSADSDKAGKIKLNKTSATLYLKGSRTVRLKASLTSGREKVSWNSSNKKVAVVNSSGKVTAKKVGKVVITAKIGRKTAKCTVTVKKGSDKKNDSKWEKAAAAYKKLLEEEHPIIGGNTAFSKATEFKILDINKDGSPELLFRGMSSTAAGIAEALCKYYKGEIIWIMGFDLRDDYYYYPKSGVFAYHWERWGIDSSGYIRVNSNSELIRDAEYSKRDLNFASGPANIVTQYIVGGQEVSKAAYNKYVKSLGKRTTVTFVENTAANRKKYLKK